MSNRGKKYPKRVDGVPSRPNNQLISLDEAKDLTQRYRRAAPASEHGGFFFAKWIQQLLAQPGVAGLRFYHGLDKRGRYRLILVGVDEAGRDVVRMRVPRDAESLKEGKSVKRATAKLAAAIGDADAVIVDSHWPCPPFCWQGSPLL